MTDKIEKMLVEVKKKITKREYMYTGGGVKERRGTH